MQHHQTIPQADHRTSPDIVGPSAIRAKNPLNTTRTCNTSCVKPGWFGLVLQGALQSGPTGWPVSAWVVGSSR